MNFLLNISICIFIWMNVTVIQMNCEPELMIQMKKVKDKIFKDYDKFIRPTNGTNTTEVRSFYLPRQIIDLDEDKAILSMDAYFFMSWFDPRLQWDKKEYDGSLQVSRSMLWVPDISIYNSHSRQVDPTQEVMLTFDSGGYIWWAPPVLTQTSCASVSQIPYPRDEVECEIIIGSWNTHGWEVDFKHNSELYVDEFLNIHPRWELIVDRALTYRNETYYECCPEPYISLHVVLPMRRRPVPEIEATRAPCILIMLLTLAIFWLPPDSNKKLILGGFLFVVLNILVVYVGCSTKAPLLVTFGVSFLQTTMYLVVITILLQVIVVIKIASQTGPARPPPAITLILTGTVGKYACLKGPGSEDLSLDRVQLKEDSSAAESFRASDEWKLLASATDRALFVVMALVMVAVHHL